MGNSAFAIFLAWDPISSAIDYLRELSISYSSSTTIGASKYELWAARFYPLKKLNPERYGNIEIITNVITRA